MSREQFHRIYSQMPEDFRAELVGGIVYVTSPLKLRHGTNHLPLGTLFFIYESNTPGTQAGDNATIILSEDSEPQPDLFLRILPECGGQSGTTDDDYVRGAPELVGEIALSSHSIDLHAKREDYARYGVQEYLVVNLRDQRLQWFDLRGQEEVEPGADGVIRVRTFPGLWIDSRALLARDIGRMMGTLEEGLRSRAHAEFVRRLSTQQADHGSAET